MAISKVRGKFDAFEGTIFVAETPDQCRVGVVIRADSINTGDLTRDEHLRSPDFLDAEHYPKLWYRGLGAVPAVMAGGRFLAS
jgi:polyisoprenoid-binding protein YceI